LTLTLAKTLGIETGELTDQLIDKGLLKRDVKHLKLTDAGKAAGGEFRYSKRYGPYFLWPKDTM
jgi:hypothetical protein